MNQSVLYQNSTEATRERLTQFVKARLAKKIAHAPSGNLDGEESVSFLLKECRYENFKVGGNLDDFEKLLCALGFSIRESKYRRYVSFKG